MFKNQFQYFFFIKTQMQMNLRIMSRKSIVHKNRMLLKNCFWPHCASLNILQFCPFCSSINVYDIDWSGFAHVDEQWVEIKSERLIPVSMHLLFHEIYVKCFLKGGSVEETLMYTANLNFLFLLLCRVYSIRTVLLSFWVTVS